MVFDASSFPFAYLGCGKKTIWELLAPSKILKYIFGCYQEINRIVFKFPIKCRGPVVRQTHGCRLARRRFNGRKNPTFL